MIIYLVRHGQTEYNKLKRIQGTQDHPLTQDGIEDAKRCAKALKDKRVHGLFSSPLLRALNTAEVIGEEIGLPVKIDDRLKERFFGKIEGESYDSIALGYDFWDELDTYYPDHGIESRESMDERALSFFRDLEQEGLESVVVVSHGAFIRSILRTLSNSGHELLEGYRVPHNGEILELTWKEDQ